MTAAKDRLVGGRYRIVRKIAEGGMGEVYEAQHNLSKKAVALKILFAHIGKDEAARERFLREVSAPAKIGHEAIVEVYDAGFDQEDGSLFVAMEYLEGMPLRDRLVAGNIPLGQLLDWFEAILDPLAAAHEAGIVHRDLKPENVFLQKKKGLEVIKVLDFGIARDLDPAQANVTQAGIAMGTPHYMAPEQAMSAKGVTAAADVWALGAMLYEALAGHPPFDGETASAIVVNACTRAHAPLSHIAPHVPPQLAAFVDYCLTKEPTQRPPNARVMLENLRHVRAQSGAMAGMAGAGHPGQMPTGPASGPYGTGAGPMGGANTAGGYGGVTPPPGSYGGGPTPHPGTFSGGPTPPPGGYTPAGTAVLPAMGTPAPGGYGTGPSSPGFGGGGGGYGTHPPSNAGFGTNPSMPGYGGGGSSFGAPGGYSGGAPAKSGGGMAVGVIAAVLIGGLVVVGGGIAILALALSGDDDPDPAPATAQVRIHTDVAAGELVVDGASRGTLVPGQQVALAAGAHAIQIREGGAPVAEGSVTVVAGQDQTIAVNRTAQVPPGGGGSVMLPGPAHTQSGSLRRGDEQDAQGKYIDRYTFNWTAGSQVQVFLDSADYDTYLSLIAPSGNAQQNDDREPGVSLNSGLTITVNETGAWTVLASSYTAHATGDYTLTVRGP